MGRPKPTGGAWAKALLQLLGNEKTAGVTAAGIRVGVPARRSGPGR